MILDSNVIIRLLHRSVPSQTKLAEEFFKKIEAGQKTGEISILVIDETIYVLSAYYKIQRSDFIPDLIKILSIKGVSVIEAKKEVIMEILNKMVGNNIDFTDYYLVSLRPKSDILSFDNDLKKI